MNGDDKESQEYLDSLLQANGVAASYIDFTGNVVAIPQENRIRVLGEMGVNLPPREELPGFVREQLQNEAGRLAPPVMLLGAGCDRVPLRHPGEIGDEEVQWTLTAENGDTASGELDVDQDREHPDWSLPVPPLDPGYYRLTLTADRISTGTFIIVAPDRAFEPEFLQHGRRLWGISTQLFALKSPRNWGIGDFSDLADLVDEVSRRGGDFILLNPLHALDFEHPENASPYSPDDRRFLNVLYIDPAAVEEYHHDGFRQWLAEHDIDAKAETLRSRDEVPYREVQALKYAVFDRLYQMFREACRRGNDAREAAFLAFVEKGGIELRRYADYLAGRKVAGIPGASDADFHLYLQWIARDQLDHAQAVAREKGMQIGLVRDLAVGATADSFEVTSHPGLFCRAASIGAPPDHFNPQGQNWGLTPMTPKALENSGFEHFIRLLRANMTSCGALRVDHIMALMRLWWCPEHGPNAAGAYVHYNTDALFAILRLESQDAGCMIIGEDLGVVPPEIRGYIADSGILSNTIFYFERYDGVSFKKPEHYNPRALAIITNHDVPTLKAWWNTSDLDLRRKIGLIEDDESYHREHEVRARDKHCLLNMLDEVHLLPQQWLDRNIDKPFDLSLCTAIIRACARSVSSLVSIQVDDLAGLEMPINIPGTSDSYANWRRKVPVPVRELFAREEVNAMLDPLREERPPC